jgi:glycosyltransferase involved in cell wall biosynthesis
MPGKMRVLWFTSVPLPAVEQHQQLTNHFIGSGGWVDSLVQAIKRQPNLELGIASLSKTNFSAFEEEGVTYFCIPEPGFTKGMSGRIRAAIHAWQHPVGFSGALDHCLGVIHEFKPDLIHIHGSENFFGLVQSITPVPIVISLQGILSVYEKFYFSGLSTRDIANDLIDSRLRFLRGQGLIHAYWTMKKEARRERLILATCTHAIGRTQWDKAVISVLGSRVHYHHCDEVMRSPFYSGIWKPDTCFENTICTISRPAPYKGLLCLIEAIALVKSKGFSNIKLRIGGNYHKEAMQPVLRRHIRELHLEENISLLGPIDADDIVRELERATVFVIPSYIENSPNSLAEAMLVGTPSIASYVGGVPSLIQDGHDGLLYPPGDSYALAGALIRVLTDSTLRTHLSVNARATARRRYDPEAIAVRTMEIYRDIVSGTQPDRPLKQSNEA